MPLFSELDSTPLGGLKHQSLDAMRAHDGWLSLSRRFHTRQVNSGHDWRQLELLPGGRWLLGTIKEGRTYLVDLDDPRATHHLLLVTSNAEMAPLPNFSIWMNESEPGRSFRVALFNKAVCEQRRGK
jgi:hypothetical protein